MRCDWQIQNHLVALSTSVFLWSDSCRSSATQKSLVAFEAQGLYVIEGTVNEFLSS